MTNPKEPKMSKKQPRGEVSTRTEVVSEDTSYKLHFTKVKPMKDLAE